MDSLTMFKRAALVFAVTLVLYFTTFSWMEHRRTRKGPWEITFTSTNGTPVVVITQPALNISDVQLQFPGETLPPTNFSARVEFRQPQQWPFPVPFGRCIYQDLTFLPGVVTFDLFGHEIELMPRTLVIDHAEHPWQNGESHFLSATNKPTKIGR
ncbi:MAG: hypothetical protein AB1705_09255 [Verrucomicrobiota bacterium]